MRAPKLQWGREFWRFHLFFWIAATTVLLISGLTQFESYQLALVRNLIYGVLGALTTLLLLPVFDRVYLKQSILLLLTSVCLSYLIGMFITLLVNTINASQNGEILWQQPWTEWFSGTLNFSLVVLLWCSFYLALKHGLRFVSGQEEALTAEAISSLSSVSSYSKFIALERNKKLVLMPVADISAIQGAGDYLQLTTDDGEFLKRGSLKNLVENLDPKLFQRVHRSGIVNLHAVRELEPKGKGDYTIVLKSGMRIPASRGYMTDFKQGFLS